MKLFSTSCETVLLGWDAPLLERSVQWLRDRFADRGNWDLQSLLCVLPTTRAVERLRELLRRRAAEQDLRLRLPSIITVGQLPERLYQSRLPVALELEQTLAWAGVLRSAAPQRLAPLLPSVPAADPIGPWLELAATLRRLNDDLSGSRLRFDDVIEHAETESERQRWVLLDQLHGNYLDALERAGLADPHAARAAAIREERCRCDGSLVLIGTTDLSDTLVAMLRSLPGDSAALIAAPPAWADRFNEFGSIDSARWQDHRLSLRDDQLLPAGDVADQAVAVAECLARFSEHHAADEVTVGVTDESQVGPVELELRGCGVATYRHLGWTISETGVGRLLDLTATYLARRDWQSLAALIRHADVHQWISQRLAMNPQQLNPQQLNPEQVHPDRRQAADAWLTEVDRLRGCHYPVQVQRALPVQAQQDFPLAVRVAELVEQWLSPFDDSRGSLAHWSSAIVRWLDTLFDPEDDASESRTRLAAAATRRWLLRYTELKQPLDLAVSGAAALEAFAARLAELRIGIPAEPDQVEILGWLDLALDDAPAMAVMGLNHPYVPAAVTNDPFLPGTLRTKLRLADNDRRFARDVHAMQLMISSRPAIQFIVGKRAADGSPTPPSRLLAAADCESVARRVRHLLSSNRDSVRVAHSWAEGGETRLPIPELPTHRAEQPPIRTLSVTAFRDYLACPYRFYLRHVLKLKPLDDAGNELAANQFGDLVHAALEEFGRSSDRDETSASRIEAALTEYLHQYVDQHFGDSVSSAVRIQVAQARRRLRVVSRRQAERIGSGWKIDACEASVSEADGAVIEVEGTRVGLRGRFDRIDRHDDGRWAILDYKTHGHRPEKKHLQMTDEGEQWVDLQLPLYRMMIPHLGIDAPAAEVELGYFNIADRDEDTGINIARFSESQMAEAERLIYRCVARMLAGDFEPSDQRVPFDDYGMILQTGAADRLWDSNEATAVEEPA